MQITLGFALIMLVVIIPGLVTRRFYYFGEFSKQFSSGLTLARTVANASIPGFINLVVFYLFYDHFIQEVDIGQIVDKFKQVNSPEFKFSTDEDTPLKFLIRESVMPFVAFLNFQSFLVGLIFGQLVRFTRLDTKFKLLRFKNYWFYLITGEYLRFSKLKSLRSLNTKHVLSIVDVLIDTEEGTKLYSGIVIDYELNENNCSELSKIILKDSKRYSKSKDGDIKNVDIPGNLLVVDCRNLRNINFTYVYEKTTSVWPRVTSVVLNVLALFVIPFIGLFKLQVDFGFYNSIFDLSIITRIIGCILVFLAIKIINPTKFDNEAYKWKKLEKILSSLLLIAVSMPVILYTVYLVFG